MPLKGEIAKAYRNYYTHKSFSPPADHDAMSLALLTAYGFIEGVVSRVAGISSQKGRIEVMYLDGVRPGRLLDVGCGDGAFLARMSGLGWAVEGIEFDSEAADHARDKHGHTVHQGRLESSRFPENLFDAVTMNHLIEHVHDPVSLMKESYRILKPGGRLIVVTPNAGSMGHRKFGEAWYLLDPPRHLILFSRHTLVESARRAGFRDLEAWGTASRADSVFPGSVYFSYSDKDRSRLRSKIARTLESTWLKYYEFYLSRKNSDLGEEIVLMGIKM
ncbi:MAG: class I SAM-dependent methyltransferase [Planctomycetota bacterium]|jgi:2-polyprenyl-3-methyl-5-hydroxy-6-metoxy-1,4-benzoquinol methylase